MKVFKIIYYIFVGVIAVIALLLVFSAFPIPGNYKVLTVLSGSMEPAIKIGSVVAVKPADDYKIGDIITFGEMSKTKTPTTHRVHDIKTTEGRVTYITKGDANNAPDVGGIFKRDIIGKILFSIPYAGFAVDFAQKPIGFVLIIVIPAVLIVSDELRKIKNEVVKLKNKRKDKQQDEKIKENTGEIDELKQEVEELREDAKDK